MFLKGMPSKTIKVYRFISCRHHSFESFCTESWFSCNKYDWNLFC